MSEELNARKPANPLWDYSVVGPASRYSLGYGHMGLSLRDKLTIVLMIVGL